MGWAIVDFQGRSFLQRPTSSTGKSSIGPIRRGSLKPFDANAVYTFGSLSETFEQGLMRCQSTVQRLAPSSMILEGEVKQPV